VGSRIAIGPGIEEVEPCPCKGAPRGAVPPDALTLYLPSICLKVCIFNKKIQNPIKKNSTRKKICFSQFQNRDRVYFRFTDFQIFLIVEFFFYGHPLPQSWGPIRVLVSRARRLKGQAKLGNSGTRSPSSSAFGYAPYEGPLGRAVSL
jgi:hypothetical protein